MKNETSPDTQVQPYLRSIPGIAHSDETRARCFVLFATTAARNCHAVERLLAEERRGTDEPVPTGTVIGVWAREDHWAEQADDVWRATKGWTHEQLQVIALANVLLGQQRRHEVLMGMYRGDNDMAAQVLKAGELSDKFVEKVLPLASMKPPELEKETDEEMGREEREALAQNRIIRKRTG